MTRKQDLRKFRLPAIILALILGITFFVVKDNITNAALAPVSADNWDLGVQIQSTSYNNNALGDYAEWKIGADELNYNEDSDRVTVKMVISYRNHDDSRGYAPGELELKVTNPFKGFNVYHTHHIVPATYVGANSNGVTTHQWNDVSMLDMSDLLHNGNHYGYDFTFRNAYAIEAGASTEGTIEIVFDLVSKASYDAVPYEDISKVILDTNITATLNNTLTSSPARIYFEREYPFYWQKATYPLLVTLEKVKTLSNLGQNPDDYYWVVYNARMNPQYIENNCYPNRTGVYEPAGHPIIGLKQREDRLYLDSDAIVFTGEGAQVQKMQDAGGDYFLAPVPPSSNQTCETEPTSSSRKEQKYAAIIGFPKATHQSSDNTLNTTIRSEAWGIYSTEDEKERLSIDEKPIILSDYDFIYDGKAISIKKTVVSTPSWRSLSSLVTTISDAAIREGLSRVNYRIDAGLLSVDEPVNFRIGDDVLYYLDYSDQSTHRLTDDDYHFKVASAGYVTEVFTANGGFIPKDRFSLKLYIRRRGQQSYSLYRDYDRFYFDVDSSSKAEANEVNFESDGLNDVVGFYYELENVDTTIKQYTVETSVTLDNPELPERSMLYNFSYAEMRNLNGDLLNVPDINSYASGITQRDVAPFDIETYGHYMQRSVSSWGWEKYVLAEIYHGTSASTSSNGNIVFDPVSQEFHGSLKLNSSIADYRYYSGNYGWPFFKNYIPEEDWRKKNTAYYLLPLGMIPVSSEEEVVNSSLDNWTNGPVTSFHNKSGDYWSENSGAVHKEEIRNRTTVTYIRNWRNTGQYMVRIDIDFSDYPVTSFPHFDFTTIGLFTLEYRIPYEAYDEYGQDFKVSSFADSQGLRMQENLFWNDKPSYYITDDGTGHTDNGEDDALYANLVDIDDDGNTTERIRQTDTVIRLVQATSTSQTIHATARGDVDNIYTAQDVMTSAGGNYSYKLRLSTGNNRNSNVVLYDNLEQDYGDNEYWQGTFKGIDVSKAEEQLDNDGNPIQIEPYYSEDAHAGSLSDDNSWHAYDDSVDKTKVRSLAFRYLNQNNEPAILPELHSSYILINMQAPYENTYDTFAYNSFHSEWNAIDNSGQIIAGISGLNSNITAVQIDNLFDITVVNEWIDGGNAYETRPDSIDFSLLFGGVQTDHHELATTNDTDTFVFADQHVYDDGRHDVTLPAITGYTTDRNYDPDTHTYTFRHTLNATYVVNVEQIWIDNDNSFELRPESNGYILRKPGADDQTSTIDFTSDETANSFTTSFTDLPLADRANTALVKPEFDFYNTSMTCEDGENYAVNCTITSTLEFVSIKVKHIWDDDDNALGARPDELFSDLLHGEDPVLGHDISTTDAEDEFTIVTIPKVLLSEFSVRIEPFAFYDTTVEHDEETNTYIFTSTLKPAAIHVQNVWVDNDNARKLRPESLVFKLNYNDAEEASRTISTADNNTSFDFDNLFEFKADGYKVVLSEAVADYETAIDYDAETRTFIFVHTLTAKEEPENTEEPTVEPTEPEKPAENKESGLPNTESVNPIPFILALFAFGAGASISAAIAIRRRS